jgi:hypothetical protein
MKRHTSATPAGVPRSRAKRTRRERKLLRAAVFWLDGTLMDVVAAIDDNARFHGVPILWYPYPEPNGADTIAQG